MTSLRTTLIFLASAASLVASGSMQMAAARQGGVPFEGISALCAITDFGYSWTAGPVIQTRDIGVLYHDVTDVPLMTGWLDGTMNQTINTDKATGVTWGLFVHHPDGVDGTLEDQYLTKIQDPVINGTFHGKGDLEGVAVEYQLERIMDPTRIPLDICDGSPMSCTPTAPPGPSQECLGAFCSPTGYCIFGGFDYSGMIYESDDE